MNATTAAKPATLTQMAEINRLLLSVNAIDAALATEAAHHMATSPNFTRLKANRMITSLTTVAA